MPYRRLPNTDKARVSALKSALEMWEIDKNSNQVFSRELYYNLKLFLPEFENAIIFQKESYTNQVNNNKKYKDSMNKLKTYLSHFLQVINLAIVRGEFDAKIREFYRIKATNSNIPLFNKESDIIQWGEKIIEGEQLRVSKGGKAIYNPKISVVKLHYDNFLEDYNHQKTLKNINLKAQNKIAQLRPKADKLIVNLWNEIENSFKNYSPLIKREKAKKYGIVYVYRKNEKQIKLDGVLIG